MRFRTGLYLNVLAICFAGAAFAAPASDFIADAAKGNLAEVKLGQLAEQKAGSKGVRSLGRTLVKDHAEANKTVAVLASAKGVPMPSEPKPEDQATYDSLSKLNGDAFDKAFVKHMVYDHQKDIDLYARQASRKDDAQVAKFAADTLPTLKSHLLLAKFLEGK